MSKVGSRAERVNEPEISTNHDLTERSHLHDILELFVHVSECELTVSELLHQLLVILQLQLIHLINQTLYVSHT